jgi:LysR family transcriptional regulator, regulator for metE and metH
MDLEIRHLKLVVAVAEEGSVTAASRRLHVTQSALSHQLRDAEEKVGAPLFLRLSKRMVPTPAGERLLQSARNVLGELERTGREIDNNGESAGVIRLSTECYTCYHWLPPLLKEFRKKYPKVEISIDADATHDPLAALREGRLDVGVVSCEVQDNSLRVESLFEDDLLLVMAPDHRLARKKSIRPQELAGEQVLIYPPRRESTFLNQVLYPAGVRPGSVLEVTLTEAILELASAGMGIGLLARWAAMPWVKNHRIAARPLTNGGYRRRWRAVTMASSPRPAYMEEFITLLRKFPEPKAIAAVA